MTIFFVLVPTPVLFDVKELIYQVQIGVYQIY